MESKRRPPVVVVSGGRGYTRAQCLRALRRRRDWLEARTAVANMEGKDLTLDEQELAALKWALTCLERVKDDPTLR